MTPADRPVVITGASSGIGEATARALAAQGFPVVLGARRLDRCELVVADIRADGGTAHAFSLDVADLDAISAFAKQCTDAVGDVEVLVSNAGMMQPAKAMEATTEQLLTHLQTNVVGTHALMQLLGRPMVERGRGDLVFITSEVVRATRPGVAPYVTSKFAIEGLITAMKMELEGSGVRISTVRPGQTLTEMGWDWDPDVIHDLLTSWTHFGLARHGDFLPASGIAAAVQAVVMAPPGVNFAVIDVEPVKQPPQKENS
jgi:NADP-dependent 3-hydroxy acid dehydrogenase YdfG